MRNEIILATSKLLKKEGLKFTVDDIASSLNISKKTVYKEFVNKEQLALEVYQFIYKKIYENIRKISNLEELSQTDLYSGLLIYHEVLYYKQGRIYNLDLVPNLIKQFVDQISMKIWDELYSIIKVVLKDENDEISIKKIIDGTINNIMNETNYKVVIKTLTKMMTGDYLNE